MSAVIDPSTDQERILGIRRDASTAAALATQSAFLARSAVDRSVSDGVRAGEILTELKAALQPAAWAEFLAAEGLAKTQVERWLFMARNAANLDTNQTERAKAALCSGALRPD